MSEDDIAATRESSLMTQFQEHHDWILKYDPLMEYWMVCTELKERRGYKVWAHSPKLAIAIELALKAPPQAAT